MKRELSAFPGRYLAALKTHLKQGPRASLESARRLGRQAVTLGLETLDVASVHEQALSKLGASGSENNFIEGANIFFTETISPIEETHHAALKANARVRQLNKTLKRRTVDLAGSNRSLKQGIAQRKTVERALRTSGEHSQTLLEESHRLQKHLRHLTHQLFSAQEDRRKKITRDLQDEIAQTLLGINVRLLTLKKETAASTRSFKKKIANTERLVEKSVKSIRRFAREFGKDH